MAGLELVLDLTAWEDRGRRDDEKSKDGKHIAAPARVYVVFVVASPAPAEWSLSSSTFQYESPMI